MPVNAEFVARRDHEDGFFVNLVRQLNFTGALVLDEVGVVNPQLLTRHSVLQDDAVTVNQDFAVLLGDHGLVVDCLLVGTLFE